MFFITLIEIRDPTFLYYLVNGIDSDSADCTFHDLSLSFAFTKGFMENILPGQENI